jgi:hypothetical protein
MAYQGSIVPGVVEQELPIVYDRPKLRGSGVMFWKFTEETNKRLP